MLDPTKSPDEEVSFGDVGNPTRTTGTKAVNATRFISEKLLGWGVEERGTNRNFSIPRLTSEQCLLSSSLDRYSPRRCRGQNRNAFYQNFLCDVFRYYEHGVVRALSFFFTLIAAAYTLSF